MHCDFELHAIESLSVANGQVSHIPLHRHKQLAEWLWVELGELELSVNGQCVTVGAGALVLIPCGQWCALTCSPAGEQRYKKLLVKQSTNSGNNEIRFTYSADPIFLASLIDELDRELQQTGTASSRQAQFLLNWLYAAAEPQHILNQAPSRAEMARILHRMEETCHLPFSLESLAAAAGLSKFHFSRHFKESVEQTPLQFVISCRMERAVKLLLSSEQPVAAISRLCGYKSATQFHAAFTRHTGSTPKRFRAHRQNVESDR